MKTISAFTFAILFLTTSAQSQTWSSVDSGVSYSSNAYIGVFALQSYSSSLFVGGVFYSMEDNKIQNMAQWNAVQWDSVGTGFGSNVAVYSLTVYNGQLIAGGAFDRIPGGYNNIAVWNGTAWSALAGGCRTKDLPGGVEALTVYNGALIAGGDFDSAGAIKANNIAKWNGVSWDTLGDGIFMKIAHPGVRALAVFNGNLYVGGAFDTAGGKPISSIAMWNGSAWSTVGNGLNGEVDALCVYNGYLYAGGGFDSAGGQPANNIAKWDGAHWQAVGSGANDYISALYVNNGLLYAGGHYDTIGGITAARIAYYDGSAWHAMGSGLHGDALAISAYNNDIYVGGIFDSAGGVYATDIARWSAPAGINTLSNSGDIAMYPNPSNGVFQLGITNYELGMNGQIEIYDMLGQKIYSKQFSVSNSPISISLSAEPDGIYLYRIMKADGAYFKEGKLIIEK